MQLAPGSAPGVCSGLTLFGNCGKLVGPRRQNRPCVRDLNPLRTCCHLHELTSHSLCVSGLGNLWEYKPFLTAPSHSIYKYSKPVFITVHHPM